MWRVASSELRSLSFSLTRARTYTTKHSYQTYGCCCVQAPTNTLQPFDSVQSTGKIHINRLTREDSECDMRGKFHFQFSDRFHFIFSLSHFEACASTHAQPTSGMFIYILGSQGILRAMHTNRQKSDVLNTPISML